VLEVTVHVSGRTMPGFEHSSLQGIIMDFFTESSFVRRFIRDMETM